MRLADKLGFSSTETRRRTLFLEYGVLENPFPPQSQTTGHPHKETPADDEIVNRLQSFLRDKQTQVLVVEGQQGYGKTNLLQYYENELNATFPASSGYYIIRYYPDPEPDFGRVVQRIVQEFGVEHLKKVGKTFADKLDLSKERDTALSSVRGHEMRQAFLALGRAAKSEAELHNVADLFYDYLLGTRLFKSHVSGLGVQLRLDTTESKTQALHDLVYFSHALGCLEGLFLFMDELEKVNVYPLPQVIRYLAAVRALIDALPKNLFLILAMTPTARDQYSRNFPALAGRLLEPLRLLPIRNEQEAIDLYNFYLEQGRQEAQKAPEALLLGASNLASPLPEGRIRAIYGTLAEEARRRGDSVTPRALLDRLHTATEQVFPS